MEVTVGVLIVGYLIVSVLGALIKKANQQQAASTRTWPRGGMPPDATTTEFVIGDGPSAVTEADGARPDAAEGGPRAEQPGATEADPFDSVLWHDDVGRSAALTPGAAPMNSNVREALQAKQSIRQAVLLAEVLGPPRAKRRTHRLE